MSFSRHLANQRTYFATLKHFKNALEAKDLIGYVIEREKSLKTPHRAKFEYFYVIANHGFSDWHIHIVSNRDFRESPQYNESTRSLKASVLYLVGNLERSARADYQGVRRYGASSLLYKQSAKRAFKTRVKLWRIITLAFMVKVLITALSSVFGSSVVVGVHSANVTSATPRKSQVIRHVERPPPLPCRRNLG